jgi:CheY-like chemotaxis protein
MSPESSSGLRLLVVEDEMLIALMIEEMLHDLGHVVVGPVGGVTPALQLLEGGAAKVDGAVLDVNLNGAPVYPVADALRARGLPFVFVTGYDMAGIASRYAAVPILQKPFRPEQLGRLVSAEIARDGRVPGER